jgi:hypothetical protein
MFFHEIRFFLNKMVSLYDNHWGNFNKFSKFGKFAKMARVQRVKFKQNIM